MGAGPGRGRSPAEEMGQEKDGIGEVNLAVAVGVCGLEANRRRGAAKKPGEHCHGVRDILIAVGVGVTAPKPRGRPTWAGDEAHQLEDVAVPETPLPGAAGTHRFR